jgi:hypothetical protein
MGARGGGRARTMACLRARHHAFARVPVPCDSRIKAVPPWCADGGGGIDVKMYEPGGMGKYIPLVCKLPVPHDSMHLSTDGGKMQHLRGWWQNATPPGMVAKCNTAGDPPTKATAAVPAVGTDHRLSRTEAG